MSVSANVDALGDVSTLIGVLVGAGAATLGSFAAVSFERYLSRRSAERDTALVFGEILAQSHARFSELKTFAPMPQLLINERVGSKPPLDSLPKYQQALAEAQQDLGGRGRILVRYSGTENLVRVMVEGDDEARIRKIAEHLRDILRDEIG